MSHDPDPLQTTLNMRPNYMAILRPENKHTDIYNTNFINNCCASASVHFLFLLLLLLLFTVCVTCSTCAGALANEYITYEESEQKTKKDTFDTEQ